MNYIYAGKLDGKILYIGKGSGSRKDHLNSGKSNVYEANRLHFSGGALEVVILEDGLSAKDATTRETELIRELQPAWNLSGTLTGGKHSIYAGVRRSPTSKRNPWMARVTEPLTRKRIHIGVFTTEVEAALARDCYVLEKGYDMPLNFP